MNNWSKHLPNGEIISDKTSQTSNTKSTVCTGCSGDQLQYEHSALKDGKLK